MRWEKEKIFKKDKDRREVKGKEQEDGKKKGKKRRFKLLSHPERFKKLVRLKLSTRTVVVSLDGNRWVCSCLARVVIQFDCLFIDFSLQRSSK